jgi:hypothetical protein
MFEFLLVISPYVAPITAVVTAATAITAVTPTQVDNKIINVVLRILNILAGNVLMNKNKDDLS